MNNKDLTLDLFKYFSRFIERKVLKKIFVVESDSQRPGYNEVVTELLAENNNMSEDRITNYVFSMNEDFVRDKLRNNTDIILYVEYGAISYQPNVMNGTREKLAVYIAFPYSMTNNDNLNETLLMNEAYRILTRILNRMEKDQKHEGFCPTKTLINFPAEIVPIDSFSFYDHSGWMAIFDYSSTDII